MNLKEYKSEEWKKGNEEKRRRKVENFFIIYFNNKNFFYVAQIISFFPPSFFFYIIFIIAVFNPQVSVRGGKIYHDHKGSNNNNDILTHENEGSQAASSTNEMCIKLFLLFNSIFVSFCVILGC